MTKGGAHMPKTVGIGLQDFRKIRDLNAFYIDKTKFIPKCFQHWKNMECQIRNRK